LKKSGPLSVTFQDLVGEGESIPASALTCLSLGGVDYLGQSFAKEIMVEADGLQPLWVGVAVPLTASGTFKGTIKVGVAPGESVSVPLTLDVGGAPLADQGDAVAKNLSRLRWLNSTVGSEPTLTHPFTPVQIAGRRIRVLGRELELGPNGLPARILSTFSPANTHLQETPREILERPAAFVAEILGQPVRWEHIFESLTCTDLEATWNVSSVSQDLRLVTSGRLDYTGSGEVHVRLCAERDVELSDARLEIPFRETVARYFMGLNRQGGRRPDNVQWKWDIAKRQDCFWLGDVNAGLMLRFKDAEYLRPPVNIYYAFRPLRLPSSWGNGGRGGVDIGKAGETCVLARATSGPRSLKQGDTLDFIFELYLTPFRTLRGLLWH